MAGLRGFRIVAWAVAFWAAAHGSGVAEVNEVRISFQYGLSYLPIHIVKSRHLIEKHAAAAGLGPVTVRFAQFNGGAAINDALLAGDIDYGVAGIAPALTLWDKTRGGLDVRAVAALDSLDIDLTSNNTGVGSIKDFTDQDRIAVPAVKVSIQSVLLQIAAEKAFGEGHHDELDRLTVSLNHPDATAAMLSRKAGISAHFVPPPYSVLQLSSPGIHKVTSSHQILGGPATLNVIYATARFRQQNPRLNVAVLAALREADDIIAGDKAAAVRIYVEEEKPGVPTEVIERVITNPAAGGYSVTPFATEQIAHFLHRTGALRNAPSSWRDYFFPEVGEGGS
ncbi:ABC transporter substrate-binding protein [Telmatospirillum siberiense]|uniref:Nitrate ABC transporter substrate-binding protein n=1 Tax=Telmatospirillum siberiense TaxID=382514 RepID=A0A2N3PXP7_9PROT|nr:ABC transporter substrate-binding protein [Telmatospirillum siberiense]PKU25184.1 nitrate ABC transporter substrate-binding protein [Telmatospirillum siberiense]